MPWLRTVVATLCHVAGAAGRGDGEEVGGEGVRAARREAGRKPGEWAR